MTDDAAVRALDLVLELTVLLGRDMAEHLAGQGLTESRAHLLHLVHAAGPTTQRDLAAALAVAPRTVTGLVDGLEASGHVTREPHPRDRRATLVTLTETGVDVATGLAEGRLTLARDLFVDWRTPAIDDLADGLEQVVGTLRAMLDDAGDIDTGGAGRANGPDSPTEADP